jgi:hypothetical protein
MNSDLDHDFFLTDMVTIGYLSGSRAARYHAQHSIIGQDLNNCLSCRRSVERRSTDSYLVTTQRCFKICSQTNAIRFDIIESKHNLIELCRFLLLILEFLF